MCNFHVRPEGQQRCLLLWGFSRFMVPALHLWISQILIPEDILLTYMWLKCLCADDFFDASLQWHFWGLNYIYRKIWNHFIQTHKVYMGDPFIKIKYQVCGEVSKRKCLLHSLCLLSRFYNPKYHSIFCNCFSFQGASMKLGPE